MHRSAQEQFDDQAADIVGIVLGCLAVLFAIGITLFVMSY